MKGLLQLVQDISSNELVRSRGRSLATLTHCLNLSPLHPIELRIFIPRTKH
ncbi:MULTISPECIES: hypothetical protein [unclassified Microcoleus]|uniref:hypothetical protein n=1 Tax=unclassified Microcoleus TaxID=2642155 RepID=UPI002FD1901E